MATRSDRSPTAKARDGLKIRVQTVRLCPWAHKTLHRTITSLANGLRRGEVGDLDVARGVRLALRDTSPPLTTAQRRALARAAASTRRRELTASDRAMVRHLSGEVAAGRMTEAEAFVAMAQAVRA